MIINLIDIFLIEFIAVGNVLVRKTAEAWARYQVWQKQIFVIVFSIPPPLFYLRCSFFFISLPHWHFCLLPPPFPIPTTNVHPLLWPPKSYLPHYWLFLNECLMWGSLSPWGFPFCNFIRSSLFSQILIFDAIELNWTLLTSVYKIIWEIASKTTSKFIWVKQS